MSKQKPVAKIKYGERVLTIIGRGSLFFHDLVRVSSLNAKMLQRVLTALSKNGYIEKNAHDQWILSEVGDEYKSLDETSCVSDDSGSNPHPRPVVAAA